MEGLGQHQDLMARSPIIISEVQSCSEVQALGLYTNTDTRKYCFEKTESEVYDNGSRRQKAAIQAPSPMDLPMPLMLSIPGCSKRPPLLS